MTLVVYLCATLPFLSAFTPVNTQSVAGLVQINEIRNQFFNELNSTVQFTSDGQPNATTIWFAYYRVLSKFIDNIAKELMPLMMDVAYANVISSQCSNAMLKFFTHLNEGRSWAFNLLDATGKIPPGVMEGTITSLGSFDQCLHLHDEDHTIFGEYCLVTLNFGLPPRPKSIRFGTKVFDFRGTDLESTAFDTDLSEVANTFYDMSSRLGVCLPYQCSQDDVQNLADYFLNGTYVGATVRYCQTKEKSPLTIVQILTLAFIAIVCTNVVLGTVLDIARLNCLLKAPKLCSWLLCFSLCSNWREFTEPRAKGNMFGVIDGIRVLSTMWLLLVHIYFFYQKETFAFARTLFRSVDDYFFQMLTNDMVLNDTFFLITATLSTFSFLKSIQAKRKFNFVESILKTYIRLMIPLLFTLGVLFSIPNLFSGPLLKDYVDPEIEKCKETWFYNLLSIHNWLPGHKICYIPTFYIAAQLQIYAITSTFIIIPLVRSPSKMVKVITAIIILNIVLIVVSNYALEYPPIGFYDSPSQKIFLENLEKSHFKTYLHLSPYLIGMLLGYAMYEGIQIEITKGTCRLLWTLALSSLYVIQALTQPLTVSQSWHPLLDALYAGLHRTIWATSIAWMIYASAFNYGGKIKDFLSWGFFTPLSKLTLMIYLMQCNVIWTMAGLHRVSLPYSYYTVLCEFFLLFTFTTTIALILHLTLEIPIRKLCQLYLTNKFTIFDVKFDKLGLKDNMCTKL